MKKSNKTFYIILAAIIFAGAFQGMNAQIGPVVALTGNVFNEISREPVTVFLMVMDEEGNRINATRSNSAENGYYYLTGLKPGKKYSIVLRQKHYFKEVFEINVANTDKYQEISKDFLVKPLELGIELKLPVPPFELNKSQLRFGAEFLLDNIKSTLLNNPNVKFEVICYPDNNKDNASNNELTKQRAESLHQFFIDNGIDAARIKVKGSSKTDPKNPPPTKKMAKGKRYIGSTYIKVTEL